MRHFLEQLFQSGQVSVPGPDGGFEEDEDAVASIILEFDQPARLVFPGVAPELDLAIAAWAARILAEISMLIVTRDLGSDEIAKRLGRPCPRPKSPSAHYSADLFFRYLPGLFVIVQRLAAEDPLLASIRRLAADWPLSSFGIDSIPNPDIDSFIDHPGMRQTYVDRILAHRAIDRLTDPRLIEAARAAIGDHSGLVEFKI